VHSPRLAAYAVIPADAGIQKPDWMPDQVRHDAEYPAACGGVVYFCVSVIRICFGFRALDLDITYFIAFSNASAQ